MSKLLFFGCACLCLFGFHTRTADYRVEVLDEAVPADAVSEQIAAQLSPTGLRIIRGSSRKLCDIWLCQRWELPQESTASDEVVYPFTPGQLIGVVRYNNKGSDFRDQDIAKGVYTLRYAHQPVDGDHVGTSPTRDFLLLVKASSDKTTETVDYDALVEQSADAAEATHPAHLMLRRVGSDATTPSMRHDEEHDWWSVRCEGHAKQGDATKTLPLELVVVGYADE